MLTFLIVPIASLIHAQKLEFSLQLNSGLFSFGGKSATKESWINVSDIATISNYTNNPYGRKNGFSYSLSAQVMGLSRTNKIFGFQSGFELLSSKTVIKFVSGEIPPAGIVIAKGKTILKNQFINLHPFFGQRLILKAIHMDLTCGTDFGICLGSKEYGQAAAKGYTYSTNVTRSKPILDFRLRAGIAGYYKHVGLSLGYSYGLINYTGGMDGANMETFSRLVRFGIIWRI